MLRAFRVNTTTTPLQCPLNGIAVADPGICTGNRVASLHPSESHSDSVAPHVPAACSSWFECVCGRNVGMRGCSACWHCRGESR